MRPTTSSSPGISLKKLFPHSQFYGADDVTIQSCTAEWNDCQPQDLFVAIVDAERDGHESVERAIENGATAVLSERLLAVDVPQCIVDNSRSAYARICQSLAGDPSRFLNTIGVTGSDGKTTVSHLLQNILIAAGQDVAVSTSLQTSGRTNDSANRSFPPARDLTPPDLANWLCNSAVEGRNHAIVEASSLQLANFHLTGVQLNAAVITNIRKNNLDYHNTLSNYRQVKLRMVDQLGPDGFLAVNLDDPVSHRVVNELACPAITFAIKQNAELTATSMEECFSEQTFMLTAGNESVPVRTEIIGRNHIYNCLAAAAVALASGIELTTIVRGLENVRRISGRLERVECGQEFAVFVDSADSPRRLASTLTTLRKNTRGRLFCVAAAGDAKAEVKSEMGRVLERHATLPVISAPLTPPNQQLEIAHQWLDGFQNPADAQVIPNRVDAIEWALGQAKPGDCVVITGFGERPVYSLDHGRWQLTDREICQAWLYEHPVSPLAKIRDPNHIFRIDDFRR